LHGAKFTLRFVLDADGHSNSVVFSDTPMTRIAAPALLFITLFHDYQRTEVMIPMRDGVKLHTIILKPADINTPAAIPHPAHALLAWTASTAPCFSAHDLNWPRDGYIAVAQDIRGRYESQGEFIMSRPMADHRNPKAIDEKHRCYDTVEWLLKKCGGQQRPRWICRHQLSGFLAMAAGIDPHPAVKAISPQAPMIDAWMGDDFFHNGAFRQKLRLRTTSSAWRPARKKFIPNYGQGKDGKPRDGFDYFLRERQFC